LGNLIAWGATVVPSLMDSSDDEKTLKNLEFTRIICDSLVFFVLALVLA
jgi:hypothetical protein